MGETKKRLEIKGGIREIFLRIIFPPRCVVCEKLLFIDEEICKECREKLPFVGNIYCMKCGKPLESERELCTDCKRRKHYFTRGVALWSYSPALKKSLYRFKYNNKQYYAQYYGKELACRYGWMIRGWGIEKIIPIPLHRKKEKQRGYNQAYLLAKELSRLTDIPVDDKIITRIRNTVPQKKLNDRERQKNIKDAFKINQNVVKLKTILLVDDIYTTGSTFDEVARILAEAGVSRIYVISLCIGRGY